LMPFKQPQPTPSLGLGYLRALEVYER